MADFIKGSQLRTLLLGNQVVKSAVTLPATTTGTLFTVTGGAVLVTSLFGVVSTATGATVTTVSLGTAPTGGTANAAGLATAVAVTSREVGTVLGIQATSGIGGALVVGATAGVSVFDGGDFVVSAGTITWTTSATDTGAVSWYLTYIPLDTGASVA